ncbi:MAG: glycogen/starch synthase [Bacteroidales bacterium]|nr:glycogen/starch synthase [Bacteroidales bacterium]
MGKGKILFVNQEIMPFAGEGANARFGRYLPQYVQEQGREIRVFMPRFSSINERRNQLHEVIRLCGMNLIVNNCDHQLIIKVGSIPQARMQVYFIDNEEYFTKKEGLFDDKGHLVSDADERLLFFCRGALEAVRKLAWKPNIIHFTGWFSCMIPFYMRRINKDNAFFSGSKCVITLTGDSFPDKFDVDIAKKMKNDGATAKDLRLFENLDYLRLMKGAITYSQGVIIGSPDVNPELIKHAKECKRNILEYNENEEQFYAQINRFYELVAGSSINN